MGPQLRALVESQLLQDLGHYGLFNKDLKFDWSQSCIEGHDGSYLDGRLENFSGLMVFDGSGKLIVDGWMEFVHRGKFFLAYWEFVSIWKDNIKVFEKSVPGLPKHVLDKIPTELMTESEKERSHL